MIQLPDAKNVEFRCQTQKRKSHSISVCGLNVNGSLIQMNQYRRKYNIMRYQMLGHEIHLLDSVDCHTLCWALWRTHRARTQSHLGSLCLFSPCCSRLGSNTSHRSASVYIAFRAPCMYSRTTHYTQTHRAIEIYSARQTAESCDVMVGKYKRSKRMRKRRIQ